jgi:hypothetical protein
MNMSKPTGKLSYSVSDIAQLLDCSPKTARSIITTQMAYRQDNGKNGRITVPRPIFELWYRKSFKNADLLESTTRKKIA